MKIHNQIHIVGSGDSGIGLTDSLDCTVYLLDGGTEWALIDTGAGCHTSLIAEQIKSACPDLRLVRKIFLTHGHGDHAGGARDLRQLCSSTVYGMKDTAEYVSNGDLKALSLDAAVKSGVYPDGYQFSACPVTPLMDGEEVTVGSLTVKAYLTEGHCSGHGCYEVKTAGETVLFSGDSIFYGGKISLQPIWDCDLLSYVETCRIIDRIHPAVFLPAHGAFSLQRGYLHAQKAMETVRALGIPAGALFSFDYSNFWI